MTAIAELLARLPHDTLDGCAAADELVSLGPAAATAAITAAAKGPRASRNTSVTRAQINLSGALAKAAGPERATAAALEHFGDDRHRHIAMFTDRKGATAFMRSLIR